MEEEGSSKDSIFEEREELMVSPTGGSPILRPARFLKPTAFAIDGQRPKLPSLPFSSEAEWPLELSFCGWRGPPNLWKKWVTSMRAKHLSVWKSAGIDEAIMGSVYKIHRNEKLVLGLAERWCSQTNTFVFAWGEATITLEDIMVLGGFSILGGPVTLFTLQEPDLKETQNNLERSRHDLERLKLDNHAKWLKLFMDSGSDIEHEAFLSLWLSRFVFSGNNLDKIDKDVFPVAVRLARGIRIALAPPVLCSIYRDMSLLRETMEMISSPDQMKGGENCECNVFALTLGAPLQFVQIWGWERIIPLRPPPNCIEPGDVRLARWHNLKDFSKNMNVRTSIDSAAETFLWRPYVLAVDNWKIPKFYKEKEQFGEDLSEELKSFMYCLRVSQLVGVDCNEPYRPNRVAMQFGFDQDIPEWIPRSDKSGEVAWCEYSRPIGTVNIPPRLLESDVTARYLEWWRKSVLLLPFDANQGMLQGRRSPREAKRCLKNSKQKNSNVINEKVENGLDNVPPGFPPKTNVLQGNDHNANEKIPSCFDGHAGFHLEHYPVKVEYDDLAFPNGNDNSSEVLQDCKIQKRNQENLLSSDGPPGFPPRPRLVAVEKHHESAEAEMEDLRLTKEKQRDCLYGSKIPGPDEIEARISRLEKSIAWLKNKHS
nr:serine/threonine-protein phosphatase 7 long form homolog [Ipomoea batatas]